MQSQTKSKYRRQGRRHLNIYLNNDKMLPCGYTVMQSYAALKRAWQGYEIAINNFEKDEAIKYAATIQKVQRQMGVPIASFPWLKRSMHGIGEHEDLARFIAGELRGDEPMEEEKVEEEIDPIYAYKSEEKEPEYEFNWSSQDFDRLKRFG